jgi:hypothetical protein
MLDSVDQRIAELEYLVGVTEGDPAGIAQDQAAPLAVEQGLAELPFEQRKLAADGLDGYAKALGGAGDAAFLGDNPEVVQVLEIEWGHEFRRKIEVKLNFAPIFCLLQCTIIGPVSLWRINK